MASVNNISIFNLPNSHLYKDFKGVDLIKKVTIATRYTFGSSKFVKKEAISSAAYFVPEKDIKKFLNQACSFAKEYLDDGTEFYNSDMALFITKVLEVCRSSTPNQHPILDLRIENNFKQASKPYPFHQVRYGVSQSTLLDDLETGKDVTLSLSKCHSYAEDTCKNIKFYNSDLDRFINKIIEVLIKRGLKMEDKDPLLQLQQLNKAKPLVVPKSILKTR